MTDVGTPKAVIPADLPVIIEQLQDQLDNLEATLRARQERIAQQAARITALEMS